jgi:hypothetical protein
MTFLVIPNDVGTDHARIWIAAINEPAIERQFREAAIDARLDYGVGALPLRHDRWKRWSSGDGANSIVYQRVTLSGLAARTRHAVRLLIDKTPVAEAGMTTLPDRLPIKGEKPFTVFLGSCFCLSEDTGGVSRAYQRIMNSERDAPEVNIFCGDQVYLDHPLYDFLVPHGPDWLGNRFFQSYVASWTAAASKGSLHPLLRQNANYFSSDDHEFWNNAPDIGLNVPFYTLTRAQRRKWMTLASQLFQVFQTEIVVSDPAEAAELNIMPDPDDGIVRRPLQTFRVGSLSFLVAETRFDRDAARRRFMPEGRFREIEAWAGALTGPGVLVLGQPLLANRGSKADWGLRDYAQYQELLRVLRRSQHWLVVLTGDVHYGRIASCDLQPQTGARIIEIISSPMRQIPLAKGEFEEAPSVWSKVVTEKSFWDEKEHFLTLEFSAASPHRVEMQAKFWETRAGSDTERPAKLLFSKPLELY